MVPRMLAQVWVSEGKARMRIVEIRPTRRREVRVVMPTKRASRRLGGDETGVTRVNGN